MMMKIYLDNSATTEVDGSVAKEVQEVFLKSYGNASSQHSAGISAKLELNKAREKIAKYIGCEPSEIVFTSGGTESNNFALRGLAKANPDKKHIITSVIEHPSIIETCKDLEKDGYSVDYVGVDSKGFVDSKDIEKKIKKDTLVVSIMHVNNEIGTIQPVEEIALACKKKNAYFHTDAVQGFTKVGLNLKNIDLMSVSGHKIHAPKGIGFLYIKKSVKISSFMTGGGQENGLRSGTENIPGIVGLSAALNINIEEDKIIKSRDKIINGLLKIPRAKINGSLKNRAYNNINVSFYGIEGESLMLMLDKDGICVSTGSACASTKLKESYVLKAIGVEELYIHGSLRLTLGNDAVGQENYIVEKIKEKVTRLREISPFKFEEVKDEKEDN
jgi:cysteine desulfurase